MGRPCPESRLINWNGYLKHFRSFGDSSARNSQQSAIRLERRETEFAITPAEISPMQQLTPRIFAILHKYMRDPHARIENSTTFAELEIDELDLPMIFLDVEDDFDVQIEYNDGIEDFSTVRTLIALVESRLEAKARPRTPIQRPKRTWMSTGAERRR